MIRARQSDQTLDQVTILIIIHVHVIPTKVNKKNFQLIQYLKRAKSL